MNKKLSLLVLMTTLGISWGCMGKMAHLSKPIKGPDSQVSMELEPVDTIEGADEVEPAGPELKPEDSTLADIIEEKPHPRSILFKGQGDSSAVFYGSIYKGSVKGSFASEAGSGNYESGQFSIFGQKNRKESLISNAETVVNSADKAAFLAEILDIEEYLRAPLSKGSAYVVNVNKTNRVNANVGDETTEVEKHDGTFKLSSAIDHIASQVPSAEIEKRDLIKLGKTITSLLRKQELPAPRPRGWLDDTQPQVDSGIAKQILTEDIMEDLGKGIKVLRKYKKYAKEGHKDCIERFLKGPIANLFPLD